MILKLTFILGDQHDVMRMALALNARDHEFGPQVHAKDLVFECGSSRAKFRIPEHPLAYPALMGPCKGENQVDGA